MSDIGSVQGESVQEESVQEGSVGSVGSVASVESAASVRSVGFLESLVSVETSSDDLLPEHWGDYPPISDENEIESLSPEIKKLLIEGALTMDIERTDSSQEASTSAYAIELPGEIGAVDENVLHTLLLHPYIRTMESLLEDIRLLNADDDFRTPKIPPVPKKPPVVKRLPIVALSENNCKSLLRKSCAALIGHVGYDTTKTAALDVLTDVAAEYLRKLVEKLRTAVDQTAKSGPSGFPYPLVRVFTEMNITIMDVRDYYLVRVKKYHRTLHKKSKELHKQCKALLKTKVKAKIKVVEVKGEMEEENIPELHFPALGEEQLQSSLEPGFQMLDSLEHDESLQNLENEEEIIVSDSPSQEIVMSVSSDFSSPTEPQNKKRKLN